MTGLCGGGEGLGKGPVCVVGDPWVSVRDRGWMLKNKNMAILKLGIERDKWKNAVK